MTSRKPWHSRPARGDDARAGRHPEGRRARGPALSTRPYLGRVHAPFRAGACADPCRDTCMNGGVTRARALPVLGYLGGFALLFLVWHVAATWLARSALFPP